MSIFSKLFRHNKNVIELSEEELSEPISETEPQTEEQPVYQETIRLDGAVYFRADTADDARMMARYALRSTAGSFSETEDSFDIRFSEHISAKALIKQFFGDAEMGDKLEETERQALSGFNAVLSLTISGYDTEQFRSEADKTVRDMNEELFGLAVLDGKSLGLVKDREPEAEGPKAEAEELPVLEEATEASPQAGEPAPAPTPEAPGRVELPGETASYGSLTVPRDTEYVDMGNVRVRDMKAFKAFLAQLPNVRKVDMFATTVRASVCDELSEAFPQLEVGWPIKFAEHTVRTDATAFSTLHYSGAKVHSGKELSVLRYCRHLLALDIGHNAVKDLSFLCDLPNLRILIIACNKVEDLTPVASLRNLEYLEIFSNNIVDISPLAGLPHLMDLNLGYNNIADFSPLYELPALKRLWMYRAANKKGGTPIPDEVIDTLLQQHPDLIWDNRHNPSEGGWREHPHFDILHEMMRSTVYVPFEDSFPDE